MGAWTVGEPVDVGLLAACLDAVADALVVADAAGRVVHVNPTFAAVSGHAPTEALGADWAGFLATPADAAAGRAAFARALRGEVWHGELTYRRRDGAPYLGRVALSPVATGGAVRHVLAVHRDITAFRRDSDAQRRAQAVLRTLLERIPDAIAVFRDGRFLYVNDALARLLGWSGPGDAVGREVFASLHPDERADLVARLRDAERAGAPSAPFHTRVVHPDGTVQHVECVVMPLLYDDAPAMLVTARDLTARRHAELRAREADRMIAIGSLASGIAHEINTPIQFIGDSAHFLGGAFADLIGLLRRYRAVRDAIAEDPAHAETVAALAEAEIDADAAYVEEHIPRAVARTTEGVARVASIVRAMKEFGHPGPDGAAPADVNAGLLNTLEVARNEVKYVADVALDLGELPPVVCHPGAINQVFLNLLVNAAHAVAARVGDTGERGRIDVRTRDEGACVRVAIADTGAGIPAAVRDRVFDPFFTTKEVGKGTGQGLAIARNAVERHGGRLWFETEEGVGTTFHVLLPVDGGGAAS